MTNVRANKLVPNTLYIMQTFRRKGGYNYQFDVIRYVSRTSDAKLCDLTADDSYTVLVGMFPEGLKVKDKVLTRDIGGTAFRVTFKEYSPELAASLGITGELPAEVLPWDDKGMGCTHPEFVGKLVADGEIDPPAGHVEPVIPVEPIIPVTPPEPVTPPAPVEE